VVPTSGSLKEGWMWRLGTMNMLCGVWERDSIGKDSRRARTHRRYLYWRSITPRQYCAVFTAAASWKVSHSAAVYLLDDKFTIYTCDVLVPSWFPSPVNYCNLNEVPHTTIITLSDWWRVYSWLWYLYLSVVCIIGIGGAAMPKFCWRR